MSEPDRFDARCGVHGQRPWWRDGHCICPELRAAESSALNAVRQYVEARPECSQLAMLRLLDDLIPPAAAPAAETGKAQGALDELAAVLRGKDEMGERLAKALGVPAGPLSRLVDAAIARIGELEKALGCLERAATAHANEHGCSGNLAARLSDARALLPPLAARAAPPEREGT